jgi:hypothetical protein
MKKSLLFVAILLSISFSCIFAQPYTIFQPTDVPANSTAYDNQGSITTGIKFRSTQAGYITAIRYYKGSGTTGTRSGHLFNSGGTLLASVTFTGETSSGWQQMSLSSPVSISANTTYIVSYYNPDGYYTYTPSPEAQSLSTAKTNGPLTALAGGTDGPNGLYDYGLTATVAPSSNYGSPNYWVDVVFTTDITAPTVSSVTPVNNTTNVAVSSTVTATLSEAIASASVTTSTFQLKDPGNNVITATVSTSSDVITLTPSSALANSTVYTATIKSGSTGVKDLSGNALASDYSWSFTTAAATGGPWLLTGNANTTEASDFLGTTDAKSLSFRTNNQARMLISAAGNVGIGTTNIAGTDYKLYVDQGIRTRKVKVDMDTWADYVFDKSYKLIKLSDLEKFIEQHKHLPDIPSAKEVEQNGLNLGENQALLLKKIEELTLYIIELNKRIEQLETQVNK